MEPEEVSASSLRRSGRDRRSESFGQYAREAREQLEARAGQLREHKRKRGSERPGGQRNRAVDADEVSHSPAPEGGGPRPGFISNEALEAAVLEPARAPRDYRPYDVDEGCEECIGCAYISDRGTSDDTHDAFKQLHELITTHNNNRCSDRQLVDIVYEFYEKEIRPWSELGEWKKQQIYEHVYYHINDPDIQSAGNAAALYCQIQSLRECCWSNNRESGEPTPNVGNIKLLADLIIKHQGLLETRRKRIGQK